MNQKFIRIYKKLDVKEVKEHLMVYGALSASCANCSKLDLKLDIVQCPDCGTDFKYISFQKVSDHWPKIQKLNDERPDLMFIDHDDFKRSIGEIKAQEFLK